MTADFAGGSISSDGGLVLLREAERRLGLAGALAGCIREWRDPERVVHTLPAMLRFRMFAIACGYEDADDCDALRGDPLFMYGCPRARKRLGNARACDRVSSRTFASMCVCAARRSMPGPSGRRSPNRLSSAAIARVSAGWVIPSRYAAATIFPASATARNFSISLRRLNMPTPSHVPAAGSNTEYQ